jgi:ATP synthase protein I
MNAEIRKPPVFRIHRIQLAALIPITLVLGFWDPTLAVSVLLGGLLQLLPSAYFCWYAFRVMGAAQAPLALQQLYRGEVGKFSLTILGFGLVFWLVKPLHSPALFCAYCAMTVSYWYLSAKVVADRQRPQ